MIGVMWFFVYWSLNFSRYFLLQVRRTLNLWQHSWRSCFELLKFGCVLRGSEIINRMLQTYCGCYELLVRFLLVEGESHCILDVCAIYLDIILFHLGIGGLSGISSTALIGGF